MPRIVLSLAEWRAVARELAAAHTRSAPPGLAERIAALVRQAPSGWPDQLYALELDEGCAAAVGAIRSGSSGDAAWQRSVSVAEAGAIVRDHQRRRGGRGADQEGGYRA